MSRYIWPLGSMVVLLAAVLPAGTAQGDVWGDVLVGLDYAGFQFAGQRNPLSDGVNLTMTRNFQNTPIDFAYPISHCS